MKKIIGDSSTPGGSAGNTVRIAKTVKIMRKLTYKDTKTVYNVKQGTDPNYKASFASDTRPKIDELDQLP